jgi:LytS/YehU family sensor histidine kinase
MLQTLVENGIKHGISKLKEGGKISITVYPENFKLHIQIRNSGQLTTDSSLYPETGYGIDNTKKRLNLIYGDEAYFHISNEDTKTVLTEIIIPPKT